MKRCDNCKNSLQLEYQLFCKKKNTDVYPHKSCEDFKLRSCNTPAEDRYGRDVKPEPKPLAGYLAEYLATGIDRTHEAGMPVDFTEGGLKPIFEQALDAYESTENVKIKIEKR